MIPMNFNRPIVALVRNSIPLLKRMYVTTKTDYTRHDLEYRIKELEERVIRDKQRLRIAMFGTAVAGSATSFCLFGHYALWEHILHLDCSKPTLFAISCVAHGIGLIPTTFSLSATWFMTVGTHDQFDQIRLQKLQIKALKERYARKT